MGRTRIFKEQGLTFYDRHKKIDLGIFKDVILYCLYTALAVFFAFFVAYFFGFRVNVLGPSMEPVLCESDTAYVNRLGVKLGLLKRGDVIAFYAGGNTDSHPYIKRVVALPGDKVEITNGVLYVNGLAEEDESIDLMEDAGEAASEIILDSNEYFVLGDQRNNSEDSRSAGIGNVTEDSIIGTVWLNYQADGSFKLVK